MQRGLTRLAAEVNWRSLALGHDVFEADGATFMRNTATRVGESESLEPREPVCNHQESYHVNWRQHFQRGVRHERMLPRYQFSVGRSMLSTMITGIGPRRDSNFNPSCS